MNDRLTSRRLPTLTQTWTSQWGPKIILLGVVAIVVSTLYPFKFTLPTDSLFQTIVWSFRRQSNPLDFLANVVLFAPLGFGITCALANRRYLLVSKILLLGLICGGLSLTIETLQFFLPGRKPTPLDIVSNSIGGAIGFLCFYLGGSTFYQSVTIARQLVRRIIAKLPLKQLIFALAVYAALASLLVVQWQGLSLKGWGSNFSLLIGKNNSSVSSYAGNVQEDFWQGTIADVLVSDRALAKTQVANFFANPGSFQEPAFALAAYSLRGKDGRHDSTGQSPDLIPQGQLPNLPSSANGTPLTIGQWLQTSEPVSLINSRIQKSAEFTLSLLISGADQAHLASHQPIIAISNLLGSSNLSLSQWRSHLYVTLNVSKTLKDNRIHEQVFPNVFLGTQPHRLVVTYSNFVLRVYVDTVEQRLVDITPNRYQIVLYLLILVPMGILLALIANRFRHYLPLYLVVIGGGTIVPSLALEGFLANGGDRHIRLANLLLGTLIMGGTILTFQGKRYRSRSRNLSQGRGLSVED